MINFSKVILLAVLLSSCASTPDKIDGSFDLLSRDYLYEKKTWFFSGRMSVADEKNAVSASIEWDHLNSEDNIYMSGPFGQGRTKVVLTEDTVKIDLAGKQASYVGNVDDIVAAELGISIPISALKYWVLGVTEPKSEYKKLRNGFVQHGWNVIYLQMQAEGELPRKMRVEQGNAKLKLIFNHWGISKP